VQRLKNSLEEFKVPRSSGGTVSWRMQASLKAEELVEEGRQGLRPLVFEILPSLGRKCIEAQEEQ
jgi:hypothetical protein